MTALVYRIGNCPRRLVTGVCPVRNISPQFNQLDGDAERANSSSELVCLLSDEQQDLQSTVHIVDSSLDQELICLQATPISPTEANAAEQVLFTGRTLLQSSEETGQVRIFHLPAQALVMVTVSDCYAISR